VKLNLPMTGLGLAIAASAAFGGFVAQLPASQPSGSRAMSVVAATGPTSVPIWSPDWGKSYTTKVTLGGYDVDMTIDTGATSMVVGPPYPLASDPPRARPDRAKAGGSGDHHRVGKGHSSILYASFKVPQRVGTNGLGPRLGPIKNPECERAVAA
jgi:hypothetical protein